MIAMNTQIHNNRSDLHLVDLVASDRAICSEDLQSAKQIDTDIFIALDAGSQNLVLNIFDETIIMEFTGSDIPAKAGGAVNGCAYAPFILTVDWLGWVCYLPDKLEFILSYHVLPS